jgi:uncharacterized protein YbjT (DUF2867 family)
MKKTAIILGATGLTGGILVDRLLEDDRYEHIKVFGRNTLGITHEKLNEYICDLLNPETFENDFEGDEVYCCIGTTAAKTPDKARYKEIDYGIPVSLAGLCKKKGIPTLLVISAMGANKNSSVFYNRVKGEMEIAVLQQEVKHTFLMQPALIGGERAEKRWGELLFKKLFAVFNFILVGPLKKYQSIKPEIIVNAMIKLANGNYERGRIPSDRIAEIGKV